jgi:hypothetical protein
MSKCEKTCRIIRGRYGIQMASRWPRIMRGRAFMVPNTVMSTQWMRNLESGVSCSGEWWMQWNFQYSLLAWPRRCMQYSTKSMLMMKSRALTGTGMERVRSRSRKLPRSRTVARIRRWMGPEMKKA